MEYCEGGELFNRIVQMQKFSEQYAASIIEEIISAVKNLHEHGIVHRDLKPENFMMSDKTDKAEVKLIDFGLSKSFKDKNLQKMKTIVGTPYYVAPEVLKGNYDQSCDIWSIGIILYIMLCGYPPFEGDDNTEIFKNVLNQEIQFDSEGWSDISEDAK
mmetsp:Transcript_28197/g.20397  ORF Transcript_28197/g.20397 Transcript_28197/m.20397 type:complete len:158 (-) Transcript_28197:764-1237(-)